MRILRNEWRYRLSFLLPQRFETEFTNHRGAEWRVWWWQFAGWNWRKGGEQVGPADPALVSSCACHDAEGNRTAAHWENGGDGGHVHRLQLRDFTNLLPALVCWGTAAVLAVSVARRERSSR